MPLNRFSLVTFGRNIVPGVFTFIGLVVVLPVSLLGGCHKNESAVRRQFTENLAATGSGWRDADLREWHGGDEYTADAVLAAPDAVYEFSYASESGTSMGRGRVWVNHRVSDFRAYFAYENWGYERESVYAGRSDRMPFLRTKADEFYAAMTRAIKD